MKGVHESMEFINARRSKETKLSLSMKVLIED
jgi:hypothetical protein